MTFTFLSWNLNGRRVEHDTGLLDEYLSCLRSPFLSRNKPSIDIIALQEIRRSTFELLITVGLFAQYSHSLDLADRAGQWGCGLLISNRFKVTSQGLLDFGVDIETSARFANQTLVVETCCQDTGRQLRLGSFHIPNGSQHGIYKGDFKRRFGHCLAGWLNRTQTSTIFGIDANSPETDHVDASKVKLFRSDSENLFGSKRTHKLIDVYLDHRRAHSEEAAAVSFKGRRKTPARFDHIWVTEDIQVRRVRYGQLTLGSQGTMLYAANGTDVLSDHAWVAAELSFKE